MSPPSSSPTPTAQGAEVCSICMDRKLHLKVLPNCKHEFCETCLEGLIKAAKDSRAQEETADVKVDCPTCRAKFPVPLDADKTVALSMFPTNHYGTLKCARCLELKATKEFLWCNKCEYFLCALCQVLSHDKDKHGRAATFGQREPLKRLYRHWAQPRGGQEGPAADPAKANPGAARFKDRIREFFSGMAEEVVAWTDGGSYLDKEEEYHDRLKKAYGVFPGEAPFPAARQNKRKAAGEGEPVLFSDGATAVKVAKSLLDLADAPLPTKFGEDKLYEDLPFLRVPAKEAAYSLLGLSREALANRALGNPHRRTGVAKVELKNFPKWVEDQKAKRAGQPPSYKGSEMTVRGLVWSIDTTVDVRDGAKPNLSVFAQSKLLGEERGGSSKGDTKLRWSCRAEVRIRLFAKAAGEANIERTFRHTFTNLNSGRGYPRFAQTDRVSDKYKDSHDSVQLEMEISAELPSGIPTTAGLPRPLPKSPRKVLGSPKSSANILTPHSLSAVNRHRD